MCVAKIILLCCIIVCTFAAPQINNIPYSSVVGAADNIGAGIANFGNGQGSSLDAVFSAVGNALGNIISGILGSGAINTAFPNYNNRPPLG